MLKKILLISCLCAANFSFANVAVDELDYSKTLILAQQGDAKTQFNLGQMYYEGKGVTQSDAQAVSWLRKAADQGDAQAKLTYEGLK